MVTPSQSMAHKEDPLAWSVSDTFGCCSPTRFLDLQDSVTSVQDASLVGKFKLKGKGEKHKIKAAKQQISLEPSNLMKGEDGKYN